MGKRDFYWSIIKKAFRPPYEKAEFVAFIIALSGGAIAYFIPSTEEIFDILVWLFPLGVFLLLSAYRLILSPYWIFLEEREKREKLENELKVIHESRPKIIVDQFRESPLFRESPVSNGKVPNYRIFQCWFRNNPDTPTESSEAKKVTALIEFSEIDKESFLFSVYGQWAISTAPDHAGYSEIQNEINIPPGIIAKKLMIALKHLTDGNCYAFSRESVTKFLDGRNPDLQLEPGVYRVRIHLQGINVKQSQDFILENPGVDKILNMKFADEQSPTET